MRRTLDLPNGSWQLVVSAGPRPADPKELLRQASVLAILLACAVLAAGLVRALAVLRSQRSRLAASGHSAQLLLSLGEKLHACGNLDEAYELLRSQAPRLVPGSAGVFYACDEAGQLQPRARWGDALVPTLTGNPCVATPPCGRHCCCLPLWSHGEKVGLLQIPATEMMLQSAYIADLIQKGDLDEIKPVLTKGADQGMHTFDQLLYELYAAGEITLEQALENADSRTDLSLRIRTHMRAAPPAEGMTLRA